MLLIVFCMALVAGSTPALDGRKFHGLVSYVGLRVSLGMAVMALIMVALAENARIWSTTRPRIWSSPWCMRRWCSNIRDAILR